MSTARNMLCRKISGTSLLCMVACGCILISLGYVQLCRTITSRVNNPERVEFWQIRSIALDLRDPVQEARRASRRGDFSDFETESLVPQNSLIVAQQCCEPPTARPAMVRGAMLFSGLTDDADATALETQVRRFRDRSEAFAEAYNEELSRLTNR